MLATIPVGKSAVGMLDSTVTAVRKLAATSGVKIAPTRAVAATRKSGGFKHRRALIVLAVIAGLALAVLLRLALRRKVP